MPKESQKQPLFDVVIFKLSNRTITRIAGRDLPKEGSFHTVDKRLETVAERLNDAYDCAAVPAGQFKENDILPDDVCQ